METSPLEIIALQKEFSNENFPPRDRNDDLREAGLTALFLTSNAYKKSESGNLLS